MREMFGDMQLQSSELRQEKSGSDGVTKQWSNGETTPPVIEVRPLLPHSITPFLHFRCPNESAPSADRRASKQTSRAQRDFLQAPLPNIGCRSCCTFCYPGRNNHSVAR